MTTQTVVQRGMRIGELAAATSLSPDTIRYYEKAGLLPDPARTPAGYRAYGPEAVDRLHFIQGAQRLGLRLEDIRNLLAIRDTGTCPCEPAADLLTRRLAELDEKIRHLEVLRAEMAAMLDALPAEDCPQPTPGTWLTPERRC
ncbi:MULTISPECIES: heavy metal-responsive transcriptional regulator [Citricoccus]|uniref:heavy metal-responsive transcriptional regulator n=1 Tax=Citricoccus TaxID=169133 RepID=UPI00048D111D|nr:heavy metal-responsive transcriptional regulator [Citricoccus sp. CH26A]